jgi:hypothetical protein
MRRIRQLRSDRGQTLVLFVVMLPVLLGSGGLVIDGAHAFGEKRRVQNAADAAALAAAQNVLGTVGGACPDSAILITTVETAAECYSSMNGGSDALGLCVDVDSTNCYTWPYKGDTAKVEVRLSISMHGFLLEAVGLGGLFDKVSARAVAGATPLVSAPTTTTIAVPGSVQTIYDPDSVVTTVTPGSTQVVTATTGGVEGAEAFTMSRICDSISYSGAGGGTVASLATNGGLQFAGASGKKVSSLGFDATRCPRPSGEPSGSACSTSTSSCAVNPYALTPVPLNWPVAPPTPPTPTSLPPGTPYPLSWYPSKCIDLGSGTVVFSTVVRPPGIYCVSGSLTILTISGLDVTGGEGYTFFALDGGKLHVNGNPPKLRFYWPSACGPRPTTRPASFTCDGRTISGYDPMTLLYATNATRDTGTCTHNAVCLDGHDGVLNGDVFAVKPDIDFPPSLAQTGGTVFIAGGAVQAGSGFFETWNLVIEGNTGSYTGNGPAIGGVPSTVTTTTPGSTTMNTTPGPTSTVVIPGSTTTVTTPGTITGFSSGLDE